MLLNEEEWVRPVVCTCHSSDGHAGLGVLGAVHQEPKVAKRPAPRTKERVRDTCREKRGYWSPGDGDTAPDRKLTSPQRKVQGGPEETRQPRAGTQAGLGTAGGGRVEGRNQSSQERGRLAWAAVI